MSDPSTPSTQGTQEAAEERASLSFQHVLLIAREQMHIWASAVLAGLFLGFVMYLVTPRTYEAKGTFLVDELPFQTASQNATDSETIHEMVQSLVLSIPRKEMKRAVAHAVDVPPSALSFEDKELPVSLRGDKRRANIRVAATRNSRLGVVTVQSCDPEFAVEVVNTIFDELMSMNKIAGRLGEVQSRLLLAQGTSQRVVEELATVTGEKIKLENENRAVQDYEKRGLPLADFSSFSTDTTLTNLKTQLILVESEYGSLAAVSTLGAKLEGKRAEMAGLRVQLQRQAANLAAALQSAYEISQTQETGLKKDIAENEKLVTNLQAERGDFARAFSDFTLRKKLLEKTDTDLSGEASVIAIVERGAAERKPVRPHFLLNMFLGGFLGLALGAIGAVLSHVLDARLRSAFQIELSTGFPCLAVMPLEEEKQNVFSDAPSPLGFLRGQLLRGAFTGEGSKIFAFSSVGKNADSLEAAAQLAILLAKSEKRTLVVDIDVENPRLAARLGINPPSGLADWLFADDNIEEHIAYSAIQELAIIDSGKLSGDVDSLFSRRPLAPEISRLSAKWDFILIHGPPLLEQWHLFLAAPPEAQLIAVAAYQQATSEELLQLASPPQSARFNLHGVILDHCPEHETAAGLVFQSWDMAVKHWPKMAVIDAAAAIQRLRKWLRLPPRRKPQ